MRNSYLKNSRVNVALCFFLLFSPAIYASEPKDTIILTGEQSIDPFNRTSISKSSFSFVTSRSWNLEKRELSIHQMDLESFQLLNVIVKIPTIIKILQCPAIAVSDSFLLLQDDYNLNWFLFKLVNGEFKMIEQIHMPPNTMAFGCRVISSHRFIMTDVYNHHPLDKVENTSIILYDAQKRKSLKVIHPKIPCIGLSHFPQNWISQNDKYIALAEPCGNKIQQYDINLNLIRTLSLPFSQKWKNLPGNKLPIETSPEIINPKVLIEKLGPMLTKFSRIETIHFANDSLLLISCIHPDSSSAFENFIYNTNQNIFIDETAVSISNADNECKKDRTYHINPYQQFTSEICISLEEDNYFPDKKFTSEENEIRKNIFYETNDPEFIIRISRINIK